MPIRKNSKTFKGKALYQPDGKAAEYGRWAINFYVGCSNDCDYCYLKKGVYAPVMGLKTPKLKDSIKNALTPGLKTQGDIDADIFRIVSSEIDRHREEIIRDGGVFFSFSTDPCLDQTLMLTLGTAMYCLIKGIPVIILTKCADWVFSGDKRIRQFLEQGKKSPGKLAIGFTLTGHDELERGASPNEERIKAMRFLYEEGITTWASIEPVIDFPSSLKMIRDSVPFCDHFKIGTLSGETRRYTLDDTVTFINDVRALVSGTKKTVYFKQSIRDLIGGGSPIGYNFVEADWDIFKGNLDNRTF